MDEFSLIKRYFSRHNTLSGQQHVRLGIGDDAAVVEVPEGHLLAQTIDTLVAERHFPLHTDPYDIAAKSLAVNVSDLVAMAATPAYFVLSLTLPEVDELFLQAFSQGLFDEAQRYDMALIGGDTCRGELSITIQASGFVQPDRYVTRSGASIGDVIFVSGELGRAALGLASLQGWEQLDADDCNLCVRSLNRPQPRLDLVPLLLEYASAAIDISDGLVGDLGHILDASDVGASLVKSRLPVHHWIQQRDRYDYALTGGDDYQILFTVPAIKADRIRKRIKSDSLDVTEIGAITRNGFYMHDSDSRVGEGIDLANQQGFNHFAV